MKHDKDIPKLPPTPEQDSRKVPTIFRQKLEPSRSDKSGKEIIAEMKRLSKQDLFVAE